MWKGSISFGLVTIPVKLYAATESKDVRFNLLHQECRTPVQYRKWCPQCDREIGAEEIVKGYEFERGRYVTLAEEEFEAIPLAAKRALEIVGFVKLEEIDPVYFDKTYYLEPGEGGAKAYALLRKAMEQTGRVAIARVVIRTKESLAALRVFSDRVLAMETMHFPDEVRSVAGLVGAAEPELRPQELAMATSLIESLAMGFEPERFENQYREALLELIQAKVQGEEIHLVEPAPERNRVVDLMEALRASIRAAGAEEPPAVPPSPPGVGAPPPAPPGLTAGAAAPPAPAVPGVAVPGLPAAPGLPGAAPALPPVAVPRLVPPSPEDAPAERR
ncbi:MAG: Ku protein [Bacillota bacterium]